MKLIIRGGKFLHRLLKQPPMEITRCTKDVVKCGFFNSLGDISGSYFLDLFGGSGAIGIEAFSRGASNVFINERNLKALNIIKDNLKSLGINEISVSNLDYKEAIEKYKKSEIKFDYIFLDPPYNLKIDYEMISFIISSDIVNKNSKIIVETDYELDEKLLMNFDIKKLNYGRSKIYILKEKQ